MMLPNIVIHVSLDVAEQDSGALLVPGLRGIVKAFGGGRES